MKHLRRIGLALLILGAAGLWTVETRAACDKPQDVQAFNYESITVSTTALGFTTAEYAPTGETPATYVTFSVQTDAVRYRVDGIDPTATEGHSVPAGADAEVCGQTNIQRFRMIRVTADSTVKVTYYR